MSGSYWEARPPAYHCEMTGELPPEIAAYYERGKEHERLSSGVGLLELLRTQQILRRTLPPPPATVLDVGGGPGAHATWLARDGYDVLLVDPVPSHVEQARQISQDQSGHRFRTELGEARRLPVDDESQDVVLLLGPLYHLTARSERVAALLEARRVLRHAGVLVIAGISRFGDWLYGLQFELLGDPDFYRLAAESVRTGQHRSSGERWFTTAYFHLPDELRDELEEAGFERVELVAVEGVGPFLPDLQARLDDRARRDQLLGDLEAIEHEASLLGASAHLLAISWKR